LKKIICIAILILASVIAKCQTYTQTFVDKCTGKTVTATTQYINGNAVVSFYNQIKTFTSQQVQSGLLQAWLQSIYAMYSSMVCPIPSAINTVVTQQASAAATQAASSAASGAATSAAGSPVTSSPTGGDAGSTTTQSSSGDQSSSTTSSSQNSNSSSSSSDTKSSSSSETKSSDSKSSDEKKKKEEEKKKRQEQRKLNPMILSANLGTGEQAPNRQVVPTMNMGISKSSMTGLNSWGINSTVYLDLSKVSIGGSYSKSEVNWLGELNAMHSFGLTYFTDFKSQMMFPAYTLIQPLGKLIVGYNFSANTTLAQKGYVSLSPSIVSFAMYPFVIKRQTLTPDLFMITSPYNYSFQTQTATRSSALTFMTGVSSDLKITRRFKLNTSVHITIGTDGGKYMRSFAIGSHVNL